MSAFSFGLFGLVLAPIWLTGNDPARSFELTPRLRLPHHFLVSSSVCPIPLICNAPREPESSVWTPLAGSDWLAISSTL